jgi:hypothetical protein
MMAAMQYAGLIGLLALIAVTPSYAQSRTAMPDGHPSHYCLPTTVDSSNEQKVYCEGWPSFPQRLVTVRLKDSSAPEYDRVL